MIDSAARVERFEEDSSALPAFTWSVPQKPVSVRIPFPLIEKLEREAVESFRSLTSRGSEIGGLLFGTVTPGTPALVSIDSYEPVPCEYTGGPLYRLTAGEIARLERLLDQRREAGILAVGFYRSHTRKGLSLESDDLALLESRFAGPHDVALLIRPAASKTSTAGIFIREDGQVHADASYLEFPFHAPPGEGVRNAGGQNSSVAGPRSVGAAPTAPRPVARAQIVPIASRRDMPAPMPPAPLEKPVEAAPIAPAPPGAPAMPMAAAEPAVAPPKSDAIPPSGRAPAADVAARRVQRTEPRKEEPAASADFPAPENKPGATARPADPLKPATAPKPADSPKGADSSKPVASPKPADSLKAADFSKPVAASKAADSPKPAAASPKAIDSSQPFIAPKLADTAKLADSPKLAPAKPAASSEPASLPEPAAALPPATPPKTAGRLLWVLVGATVPTLLLMGLVFSSGTLIRGNRGIPGAQDPSALSLRIERSSGDIVLTWNRDSLAIQHATRAVLSIVDGTQHENVEMDLAQLRNGSIVYAPVTGDVVFRMEVTGAGLDKTTSESVRVLRTRPSPMPAPAGPVQAPKPAALAAPPAGGPNAGDDPSAVPPEEEKVKLAQPLKPFSEESLAQRLRPARPADLPVPETVAMAAPQVIEVNLNGIVSATVAPPPAPAPAPPVSAAAVPPAAAPAPEKKLVQGGQIQQAQLIYRKAPDYPKLARESGAGGVVELLATIGTNGKVKSVQVVKGHPLLRQAAVEAVQQWIYKPTMLNGAPVEAQTEVLLDFKPQR